MMRSALQRIKVAMLFAVAIAAAWSLPLPALAASGERAIKAPHSAFNKAWREDLLAAFRDRGEVRVLVGLQTADEVAPAADPTPDFLKEQRTDVRLSRVLKRLAGFHFRDVKQLRQHPFFSLTVDAATLNALLADPDVTSITEDRPVYPVLQESARIIRADLAWADQYKGSGQTVAIIDTGVDLHSSAGESLQKRAFQSRKGATLATVPPVPGPVQRLAVVRRAATVTWAAGTVRTWRALRAGDTACSVARRAALPRKAM
jgi:hypothetical protein